MSTTKNASGDAPYFYFTGNWYVPDEAKYGELADTLVYYNLDYKDKQNPTLADLTANVTMVAVDWDTGWDGLSDDRAQWHRNTTPIAVWMRAHAFRLVRRWTCSQLAEWFEENPAQARQFGFVKPGTGLSRFTPNPPSQSRLWEVWNQEFSHIEEKTCRRVACRLAAIGQDTEIPYPTETFEPEKRTGTSERSTRRLTEEKTKEVWRQAKPLVTETFFLDRGDNTRIPDGTFWEAQALAGTQQDNFTEGGIEAYRMSTTRPVEQLHTGRTHRHHLQKHSVEDVRSMLRDTTKLLIKRARRKGELQGRLWAAIDITKGNPWTGQIEWTDDDKPTDPYILGYKDKETKTVDYYFQWATIQIVGFDIPLVLDAIPRVRGLSKDEIVDDLLGGALEVVPDIDLVMMDREFDSEGVKNACDKHGVHYLNPARKHSSEKGKCSDMLRSGKKIDVSTQQTLSGPNRHRVFLPALNTDVFDPPEVEDDGLSKEEAQEQFRQELVDDFMEIGGVERTGHGYEDLIDEIEEGEGEARGNDEDVAAYALFETNHPAFKAEAESREALLSNAESFISRYSNRWGIENGYKQLKKFRVRTTSKNHEYRYFCFAFACVLYNVWRLVDLLVKLAFEDDPDYAPRVKAATFLVLAGKYIGLDPPD